VLLGSATPSVESYYNAASKKYGLVQLNTRYGGLEMPEIGIVDMLQEQRAKTKHEEFSSPLLDEIAQALARKEQVILFRNRRGFALRLECNVCGYTPYCDNCDVSLTYHKNSNQLKCHYCGMAFEMPTTCPKCGNTHLEMKGFGTEKIEDDLAIFFPDARIARMDYDTTRSKNAYHNIITDFESHETDILVGTQMVTKGLDFDNVSVVGIINADNLMSFPDFRAGERGFQQMMQVAGRAGRTKHGKVLVQTRQPDNIVIKNLVENNYIAMYEQQIAEREKFHYPPFYRLIRIAVKHKDYQITEQLTSHIATSLKHSFGERVLGPNFPLVAKIQNYYIKEFLIKFDKKESISNAKKIISEIIADALTSKAFKPARILVDIDPN
jgi:primosomal protein N' (replication factor Y)